MNPEDLIAPGIYSDTTTGDIWEKSKDGKWRVNGMPHKPFPIALVPVQTEIYYPTVSIDDAVADSLERKRRGKETGSI